MEFEEEINELVERELEHIAHKYGTSVHNSGYEQYSMVLKNWDNFKECLQYIKKDIKEFWWTVKSGNDLKQIRHKIRFMIIRAVISLIQLMAMIDRPVETEEQQEQG